MIGLLLGCGIAALALIVMIASDRDEARRLKSKGEMLEREVARLRAEVDVARDTCRKQAPHVAGDEAGVRTISGPAVEQQSAHPHDEHGRFLPINHPEREPS